MSQDATNGLTLVKLGGSVITDKSKPFTERRDVIKRLAEEIHSSKKDSRYNLIIGNGGGSYPHIPAKKYQVHKGLKDVVNFKGVTLVQDAAARLNRLIVSALIDTNENVMSIQPSASILAKSSKIIEWDLRIIREMLNLNLIPVVYGDVIIDVKQGYSIVSTEEIFFYLANNLNVKRIIIGSDTDGVIDKRSASGKKVEIITPSDRKWISSSIRGAETIDVTGGMKTKVELLLTLAEEKGIESEILNATKPGLLELALKGKKGAGTIIRPN